MQIRGDIPVENFIEEFYNYRDKGLIIVLSTQIWTIFGYNFSYSHSKAK